MVVTRHRAGGLVLLLSTLTWAVACVSGGDDGAANDGPECYTNADCSGGRECSFGVCVGFNGCANGCRNNEDCLDNVCRLTCFSANECTEQGLTCGTDTKHCKPGQNPTRPQSQPQSGTGGTGSTGSGGTGSGSTGGSSTVGGAGKGSAGTGGTGTAGTGSAAGSPGLGGTGGSVPAAGGTAGQAPAGGGRPGFAAAGSSSIAGFHG